MSLEKRTKIKRGFIPKYSKIRDIKKRNNMSKKRRNFSAEFKAKVVIELLEGEKTVSEIASKYNLLLRSVQQ
jgi:transposase-like protein